jgi:hypothetical protein
VDPAAGSSRPGTEQGSYPGYASGSAGYQDQYRRSDARSQHGSDSGVPETTYYSAPPAAQSAETSQGRAGYSAPATSDVRTGGTGYSASAPASGYDSYGSAALEGDRAPYGTSPGYSSQGGYDGEAGYAARSAGRQSRHRSPGGDRSDPYPATERDSEGYGARYNPLQDHPDEYGRYRPSQG